MRGVELLRKYLLLIYLILWFFHALIHKTGHFAWLAWTLDVNQLTICAVVYIWHLRLFASSVSGMISLRSIVINILTWIKVVNYTRLKVFINLCNALLFIYQFIRANTTLMWSINRSFLPLTATSSLVLGSTIWSYWLRRALVEYDLTSVLNGTLYHWLIGLFVNVRFIKGYNLIVRELFIWLLNLFVYLLIHFCFSFKFYKFNYFCYKWIKNYRNH